MVRAEDPALTALVREQTRLRTMGFPPPQVRSSMHHAQSHGRMLMPAHHREQDEGQGDDRSNAGVPRLKCCPCRLVAAPCSCVVVLQAAIGSPAPRTDVTVGLQADSVAMGGSSHESGLSPAAGRPATAGGRPGSSAGARGIRALSSAVAGQMQKAAGSSGAGPQQRQRPSSAPTGVHALPTAP